MLSLILLCFESILFEFSLSSNGTSSHDTANQIIIHFEFTKSNLFQFSNRSCAYACACVHVREGGFLCVCVCACVCAPACVSVCFCVCVCVCV